MELSQVVLNLNNKWFEMTLTNHLQKSLQVSQEVIDEIINEGCNEVLLYLLITPNLLPWLSAKICQKIFFIHTLLHKSVILLMYPCWLQKSHELEIDWNYISNIHISHIFCSVLTLRFSWWQRYYDCYITTMWFCLKF